MNLSNRHIEEYKETDEVFTHWLEERQEMLSLYYNLTKSGLFPEEEDNSKQSLEDFCQVLTDYLSACHFEIELKALEAYEKASPKNITIDENLEKKLTGSTDKIMQFVDAYADHAKDSQASLANQGFKKDLSDLGVTLAERMDLEDQLIKLYLNSTTLQACNKSEKKNKFKNR